jgi:hypothetical protein
LDLIICKANEYVCQAHAWHKFSLDLLCPAPEPFQTLLSIALNIHVNNLDVTAVDGRVQSLQPEHVSIDLICIESWILSTSLIDSLISLAFRECLVA